MIPIGVPKRRRLIRRVTALFIEVTRLFCVGIFRRRHSGYFPFAGGGGGGGEGGSDRFASPGCGDIRGDCPSRSLSSCWVSARPVSKPIGELAAPNELAEELNIFDLTHGNDRSGG